MAWALPPLYYGASSSEVEVPAVNRTDDGSIPSLRHILVQHTFYLLVPPVGRAFATRLTIPLISWGSSPP